jgi:leader peptidase (prepilin peptidase)/N-methyltransferase
MAEPEVSGFALIRALPSRSKRAATVAAVALAIACFARFGFDGRAVVGSAFSAVLVLLTATDLFRRRIPNVIVVPSTIVLLAAQIALYPGRTVEWVLACLLAALFLFVPLLVVPTGMGMGDVKLAALLGAVLGKSVIAALLAGVVAGALYAIFVLVREGLSARKKSFAYGPYLAFGGVLLLLIGGR